MPDEQKAPDSQVADYKEPTPRFGRLLAVCAAAAIFCGFLVWFATTYLGNCCAP